MSNVIVDVEINNKQPTKYNYKYFVITLDNGFIQMLYYNINNPIPSREEIIGLTLGELIKLCIKKLHSK